MPRPTQINYRKLSRVLEVSFDNGKCFALSAEYLRVYSPSAEVRGHGPGQQVLQTGKEQVAIDRIEPVGNYAVRLHFDDGHDTGIYSFEELYDLGTNQQEKWRAYLQSLEASGYRRNGPDPVQ